MASAPSSDPDSSRRDGPVALAIAAVVAATVVLGTIAPSPRVEPASPRTVMPDADPSCVEWSDGCRVCRRLGEGPVCSTPGIACTPGEQQCLHRAASP